jgi:hypothetical protein
MSRPPVRNLFKIVHSGLEKVALACAAFGLMHATARAGESAPPSAPAEEQWGGRAAPEVIANDAWSNPAAISHNHNDAWSAPPPDHFRSAEQIHVAMPESGAVQVVSKTLAHSVEATPALKEVRTVEVAEKAAKTQLVVKEAPSAAKVVAAQAMPVKDVAASVTTAKEAATKNDAAKTITASAVATRRVAQQIALKDAPVRQMAATAVPAKAPAVEAPAANIAEVEADVPNPLAMDQSDWNDTPRGRAPGLIAGNDAWRNRAASKTDQNAEPGAANGLTDQPAASTRNGNLLQIDPWSAAASASVASNNAARAALAPLPLQVRQPQPFDASSQWRFAISPSAWLPRVSGSMRFAGASAAETPGNSSGSNAVDASIGPYNDLQHVQSAAMIQGDARKGNWSVFADTVLLSVSKHDASIKPAGKSEANPGLLRSAETAMRGAMIELGGGFSVFRQSRMLIDAIAGVRYLGAKGTLDASASDTRASQTATQDTSQTENSVNGFAGVRGRIAMTPDGRWYVPFHLDAGTGTSKVTWQAMTGIGYVMKWADLNLVYRYLAFHGSNDQLMQTVRMSGPGLGATVRF